MFNKLKLKKDVKSKSVYGGINMDKHWIIDKIEKLEIKNKDTDVVVLTFDPTELDFCFADQVFKEVKKCLPENKVIGLVKGFELEVDNIDKMIDKLEKLKEEKANEDIH